MPGTALTLVTFLSIRICLLRVAALCPYILSRHNRSGNQSGITQSFQYVLFCLSKPYLGIDIVFIIAGILFHQRRRNLSAQRDLKPIHKFLSVHIGYYPICLFHLLLHADCSSANAYQVSI